MLRGELLLSLQILDPCRSQLLLAISQQNFAGPMRKLQIVENRLSHIVMFFTFKMS